MPSSDALLKPERVVYECLGLRALELDHRGRPQYGARSQAVGAASSRDQQ